MTGEKICQPPISLSAQCDKLVAGGAKPDSPGLTEASKAIVHSGKCRQFGMRISTFVSPPVNYQSHQKSARLRKF